MCVGMEEKNSQQDLEPARSCQSSKPISAQVRNCNEGSIITKPTQNLVLKLLFGIENNCLRTLTFNFIELLRGNSLHGPMTLNTLHLLSVVKKTGRTTLKKALYEVTVICDM